LNLRLLVVLPWLGSCLVSACSLLVPVGRLTDDARDPPDDAATDLGRDADPVDASDAGLSRPCAAYAAPPLFCDDFDRLNDVSTLWATKHTAGRGTVDKATDAVTPPSALRATVEVPPPDASSIANVNTKLTGLPRRIRYEYDLRVVAKVRGWLPLNRITLGDLDVTLEISATNEARINTKIGESSFQIIDLPTDQRFDRWRHVAVIVDVTSAPVAKISVTIDDEPQLVDQTLRASIATPKGTGGVMAGIYYIKSDDGPWTVLVDNAVLTAAPLP